MTGALYPGVLGNDLLNYTVSIGQELRDITAMDSKTLSEEYQELQTSA